MQVSMDRLKNWTSSSLKDSRNHFKDWLLEETIFKDEGHALFDAI